MHCSNGFFDINNKFEVFESHSFLYVRSFDPKMPKCIFQLALSPFLQPKANAEPKHVTFIFIYIFHTPAWINFKPVPMKKRGKGHIVRVV